MSLKNRLADRLSHSRLLKRAPFGAINFLSLAKFFLPLSVLLSLAALICVSLKGFVYGVDFAGGNEIHARFPARAAAGGEVSAAAVRRALKEAGFSNPFVQSIALTAPEEETNPFHESQGKTASPVQEPDSAGGSDSGSPSDSASDSVGDSAGGSKIAAPAAGNKGLGGEKEFLIRTEAASAAGPAGDPAGSGEASVEDREESRLQALRTALERAFPGFRILRLDSIGPQIGQELRQKGILAVFYSLLMILIYLGIRFDSRYAPAAVFCLFHDAIITLSVFSLFRLEVTVQTLAAVLAIIGYSLNDTIVTFDRIRENQTVLAGKQSFFHICNQSLNDVLSRTLLTSITTLIAVGAMYVFADGAIKDFAFTLALGVVIGTYSSLFTATPLLYYLNRFFDAEQAKKNRKPGGM